MGTITAVLGSTVLSAELVAVGGITKTYVDGSIATRDSSIAYNLNQVNQLDASVIRIDAYNIIQDTSIVLKSDLTYVDTSLNLKYDKTGGTITGDVSINGVTIDPSGLITNQIIENSIIFTDTSTYELVYSDGSKFVSLDSSSATRLIIPSDASVAFKNGTNITVMAVGIGQVEIDSSATLLSAGGNLKLRVQYSSATLIKKTTDIWYVLGDLSA